MHTSVQTPSPPATRIIPVTRYSCHLFASRSDDNVVVFLYGDAANVIARVFFTADDQPLPPASMTDGVCALHFPRSSFPIVLDLLRHESPIQLRWAGPVDSCLSTAFEPVGEGETISGGSAKTA